MGVTVSVSVKCHFLEHQVCAGLVPALLPVGTWNCCFPDAHDALHMGCREEAPGA